ncbi:branched-chain amino acid ABC transporter permease [Oxalobacteraceae bacterium]|nr:branched-chain amino acid ABC transporter permease [Oxalobacteraceae bacterium]
MLAHGLDGLTRGACYALLAIGFTLVFGILRRVNLAYGASIMLGVYAAIWLERRYGAGLAVLGPVLLLVTAAAGVYVERLCFAPHAGAAPVTAMAASFAVWMQLEELATLMLPRHSYGFPALFSAPALSLGGFSLRPEHLLALACAVLASGGLWLLLYRTRFGLAVRAMTDNRAGAACVGIHVARLSALIFALASALGAVAGYLIVSIDGQVTPMFAMWATLKGMVAAMLGGLGSLAGAVAGGVLLGLIETGSQSLLGPQYRDICSYGLLLLVLLVCPQGMAGRWRARTGAPAAPAARP